ncbi:hypothetical protein ABSA28_00611 [Candidatus Hepatincolaceae symbiont of Richtersius coronifer]
MQQNLTVLQDFNNIMEISLKDIIKISSEEYSILEINNQQDLNLISKLYNIFIQNNQEYIKFARELDMTNNRYIMK